MIERLTLEPHRLVVFTGAPGSGKTFTIEHLQHWINCRVVRKDDIAAHFPASHGRDYLQKYRQDVYEQLYQDTGELLAGGHTVLVDALHRFEVHEPGWENRYRQLARTYEAELRIIRLVTTPSILKQRLEERNSPFDADKLSTEENWLRFMREQPIRINTLPDDCSREIDNSGPLLITVKQALAFIVS